MPLYEHTLIARQDISPPQVDALVADVKKLLSEHGGEVVKEEYWGLRNLQYRIKKNRKGHYAHLGVNAPPEAMAEVERQLRIHEDVLRYLTIRVDAIDHETPSPILAKREERRRRDRGDRDDRDRGDRGDRDRGDRGDRDRGPRPERE